MKNNLKSYWSEFRPHILKIILAFGLSALATGGSFTSIRIMSAIVDKISAFEFSIIELVILFWFIIEILGIIFLYLSAKIIFVLKAKVVKQLRWKILRKADASKIESIRQKDSIDLAEIICKESNILVDAVNNMYAEIFTIILGLSALVYTAIVCWELAALIFGAFLVILIVQYFAIKRMVLAQEKARKASVSTLAILVQAFQAFADIKVQGLRIKIPIANSLETEIKENVEAEKISIDNQFLSNCLSTVVQAIFLLVSTFLVMNSRLELVEFIAVYMYKGYVFSLVGAIIRIAKNKSHVTTAIKRMNSILQSETVQEEKWGTTRLKNPSGEIEMRGVTVKRGDTTVIDNLDAIIPAEKVVVITGTSGGGKTTVVEALAKVVPLSSGSIKLDGIELADLTKESHRRAITLAPQDPILFDFTIKENLLLANPDASDETIWNVLKQCHADKFVLAKGGLDAVITPKELSGGQKQRLALARMVLCGGKILLLDESTSALDGESQEMIVQTFKEAAAMGHTVVMVAHRVNVLKKADVILFMEDGKILETGTYNELYERSEKFRRLVELG